MEQSCLQGIVRDLNSVWKTIFLSIFLSLLVPLDVYCFPSAEIHSPKTIGFGFHWCALLAVLIAVIAAGILYFFTRTLNLRVHASTEQLKAELKLREQAEHQLKLANEQLDGIFNVTTEFVALTDRDGVILRANQALAAYYNMPLDQFVGSCMFDYFDEEQADQRRLIMNRILSSGTPERFELSENDHCFDCSFFPMKTREGDGPLLAFFIRDITQFQDLVKESQRASRILRDMNTELEGIIRIASHDLKTPLVTINGFAGELARACKELIEQLSECQCTDPVKEKVQRIIEKDILVDVDLIKAGTGKVESLVSSLLKLARIGHKQPQDAPIKMPALIEKIQKSLAFQIREHDVRIQVDAMPDCMGDESMINQVMTNLISNAIKYRHHCRPVQIRISGYIEDGMSVYCVEDNGVGIIPEYQEKIFELFYRMDPGKGEGEGLGLSIVRGIVNRHNGRIWVESIPDEGSRFFVALPELSKLS